MCMLFLTAMGAAAVGLLVGALVGGSVMAYGWKLKYDNLMKDLVATQKQVQRVTATEATLNVVKATLADTRAMNDTTVKLNDFYSSKIAKIQAVLNEKE